MVVEMQRQDASGPSECEKEGRAASNTTLNPTL